MVPRAAVALGIAGLATAGLGTSVLGAPADDPVIVPEDIATTPTETTPVAPPATTSTTPAPPPPAATSTTPTTPAPPTASTDAEPKPRGKGAKQHTTGEKPVTEAVDEAGEDAAKATGDAEDGDGAVAGATAPTAADPTLSIATPGAAPIGIPNFFISKFRIPPFLLPIYQAAGTEYGVRWEVLAAINEIETDYGRNLNVSSAGAVGWMQFMPATWKRYGIDANGDERKDPYNPVDAIFSAARYLKAAGADEDLKRAIFAYNHADWYVDSVLMRARLIGGLPSNLIGSLTGLTQGRFPVAARARYADDLSRREAEQRVARGRNAAVPVEPRTSRRGINIYAKRGAAVVAVQDGKVVRLGRSDRLGKYVQLRDAYGNTYTYAHLASIARTHAAPRTTRAGIRATPTRHDAAWSGKERVFANPQRPRVLALRGAKPLKTGSQVTGGTILGRVGELPGEGASHVLFAIRPAGRGAPLIDPKPILDGWKLLESTAIYRAKGRNPFFGDGAEPSIGQILLMSKASLEHRVVTNPRIGIYDCGRRDVKAGRIDRRVLATLEFLAASGLRPTVTSLECGHSTYTKSGNVSEHSTGTAVDIGKINGIPVLGHQGEGSITDVTVRRLLTLQGTMKPHQIISLMTYEGMDNTFAMGDHADHVHVGFRPLYGSNSKLGRQLSAVLKPGQWIKLVDRLGELENPVVDK